MDVLIRSSSPFASQTIRIDHIKSAALRSRLIRAAVDRVGISHSVMHIEKGDELEVACLEFADRLEIYGIRNHTDGSVYLARTALVASARWELACVPILLGASLLLAGICYALGMDPGTVVEWSLILGIAAPACILVLGAIARVFGWVLMPEVRGMPSRAAGVR